MINKPNVILCLCDQLRAFELGCYGNRFIQTPNIDALAENGVRFEVACSNNPVCSPSRSSLLTGQYSRTCTGRMTNHDVNPPPMDRPMLTDPTVAECFQATGYHTALIGKWHIHPHPNIVGFDYALYPHFRHRNTGQTYYGNDGEGFCIEGFAPDYESRQVAKYLQMHKDEPFFLHYNISPPHMPLDDAPEKYKTMYSPMEVPLRKNVRMGGKLAHDENWFKTYMWDFLFYTHHLPYTETLPEGFDIRQLTALYYGLTSWVDDLVDALMKNLETYGLLDNTLVIFTSDHGDNLGSHHQFNKQRLIEESIRIPMILHSRSMLDPSVQDKQIASIVDVMPTLLGLTGQEVPDSVQGQDLSPVVLGKEDTVGENMAFIENHFGEIGMRTPSHLYGLETNMEQRNQPPYEVLSGEHLLYDISADPFQLHNLAFNDSMAALKEEMRHRLVKWNKETPWLDVPA